MGSKADFYVGRGLEAEWLGSLAWDGLPAGLPRELLGTTTEDNYRRQVGRLLRASRDGVSAKDGWPWTWTTSHGTNYTYTFERGVVYACCFGSNWWRASDPEPDHTTLTRKAASFPDMTFVKKGGRVFIAPASPEPDPEPEFNDPDDPDSDNTPP
jgi:hypothetical protein